MPSVLDSSLALRIEEASLNAWPAMQQILLEGWILRFSKGFTKRSNSIVPLYAGNNSQTEAPDPKGRMAHHNALIEKVRYCENLYTREALQTVFRLTSIPAIESDHEPQRLDTVLAQRGYTHHETSIVLSRAIDPDASQPVMQQDWQLKMLTLADWLAVYCQLTGMAELSRGLHSIILQRISGECGFATLWHGTEPVACGLAVVERGLVGLFDIYTGRAWRNLGCGHQLVSALLNWGATQGAKRAYLQVLLDNASATALYANIGFKEVYRYWYRIAP